METTHACGPTGPGSVILELGEHVGALILEVPPTLEGREIEISPTSGGLRTHAMVRQRRTAAGVSYAAVYPNLPAVDYAIWRDRTTPVATVTVSAAHPTTYRWPCAAPDVESGNRAPSAAKQLHRMAQVLQQVLGKHDVVSARLVPVADISQPEVDVVQPARHSRLPGQVQLDVVHVDAR